MFGQDSELGGARKDMDKKLENLQNATETAILGNTEELKKMNDELKENQDFHTQMLQEQKQVLGAIQDTTERISTDVQKLILAFEEHKRERAQEVRKKPLVNDQMKAPLARQIRAILPNVESELHEYHILKETLVPETGNWIFEDPCWEQWLKQDDAAKIPLAITGQPGTGKSHLATIMFDKLQKQAVEDTSKHTCVAHFHFREQHQSLWYFLNAVISCTNQVAEQSVPICEAFLAQWRKDDVTNFDLTNWRDVLKIFLAAAFHKESKYRLFIVFDGVDEIKNLFSFTDFLKLVKELELRVVVAFTSRSHVLDDIYKESPLLHLDVNRERQVEDLKTLIWSRLSTLQPIRRFSSYVKQRIVNKLVAEAPSKFTPMRRFYAG
jgi:Cdc6-like AAA superfamily ATPase